MLTFSKIITQIVKIITYRHIPLNIKLATWLGLFFTILILISWLGGPPERWGQCLKVRIHSPTYETFRSISPLGARIRLNVACAAHMAATYRRYLLAYPVVTHTH